MALRAAPKDEEVEDISHPTFCLAQLRHQLLSNELGGQSAKEVEAKILSIVKENSMLPYYEKYLCPAPLGPVDEALKQELSKRNEEELAKLNEKIEDAKENLGDVEIHDAFAAKALFFNRIGDKEAAFKAYADAYDKTVGVGGRLDNILTVIRIAFFFDDKELAKKEIDRAKIELSKGGDWERRNKLKVYEGMFFMIMRQWKDAANLFINVMPTFTATELVEFKDFVLYTVLLSMVALDRPAIRDKLVKSPEVLSAIKETPHLQDFLESYYYCQYMPFMKNFVHLIDTVRRDRYLSRHSRHFTRMMRLNAYQQFLASYRSVKLEAMASEFGLSAAYMDSEIASFISSGKLTCKIDKVGGIIESNESDERSKVYVDILKHGDVLLNRMQKLSGALDM